MKLKAQTDVAPRVPNPFTQLGGGELLPNGGEGDGVAAVEIARADLLERPVEVGAIGQNELDLVSQPQELQILGQVRRLHSRSGSLYVQDLDDSRIEPIDANVPSRLDHHGPVALEQVMNQRVHPFLLERLASGDFHQVGAERQSLLGGLRDAHLLAAGKRIDRVAPDASQGTARQSNEGAGKAGASGFALKGFEDLGDSELGFHSGIL